MRIDLTLFRGRCAFGEATASSQIAPHWHRAIVGIAPTTRKVGGTELRHQLFIGHRMVRSKTLRPTCSKIQSHPKYNTKNFEL